MVTINKMPFDPEIYGPQVAAILKLAGEGACDRATALIARGGAGLFTGCRAPDAAVAGLYVRAGCWKEAHETAQNDETREGSYWHAIVHREEPDPANSAWWFGRVGEHPIFPALCAAAAGAGVPVGAKWNPTAFIDLCEKARAQPGSELDRQCRQIRDAEWQLLFDWCAAKS